MQITKVKAKEMGMIILISISIFFIIMPIRLIYLTETFNPIYLSTLFGFVFYFLATYFLSKKYEKTIKPKKVLLLMLFGFLLLQLPLRIISFEDTFTTFPDFLIGLLGLFGGYISFIVRRSKWYIFAAGIILCAFMWLWGYPWFYHWLNFGTTTGRVEKILVDDINMSDVEGNNITLYQKKGKILVLDCWYEGCRNCFREFPNFQRVRNDFKQFENIEFYALGVNFNDTVNLFEVLKEWEIEQPMYTINKVDASEKFGVSVYPTIIIIDDDSKLIYRGNLTNCEFFLKKYISDH